MQERSRGLVVVEFVRLGIVLGLTAVGYALGPTIARLLGADAEGSRLLTSVLGALTGYVLGGVAGRFLVGGVERVESELHQVDATDAIAGAIGALLAMLTGLILLVPLFLLPARSIVVPVALATLIVLGYAGARIGGARGGDLLRFLGARGRVEVTSPARGVRTKLVDTSALVDGRVVEVARAGFLDGTLVIPTFVLDELQGLADAEEPRRRGAGRRGLDTLTILQDEELVAIEVTDDEVPGVAEVDARLTALARERKAALLTVDANLARVAEISGVRVLNLHLLAEAVRPPVVPGERVVLAIVKPGREEGQGVGYLPDGTMVVVERAAPYVGGRVTAEVTSLLQTRNGRMVFATVVEESA